MRRVLDLLPLLFLAPAIACASEPVTCSPLPPWAVAVDVRDSVTDQSVLSHAQGAVFLNGTLEDSLRHDRLVHLAFDSLLVGGNTVGLVEVHVEHPTYQPWVAANVQTQLSEGECPAWETQLLIARLQPVSP